MSLSIRTQIIAPLLFTICGGMATAAFVGYEAISGQRQVEAVVQHALSAKSLAAKMSTQFEDVNAFVKSVTDMTTFVSAADIKAKFAAANEALGATLAGMEETKVSAALDSEIASLQADHDVWSKDAQLVLGLVPSTEIPTLEKINRNTQVMFDRINALNAMVDEQAIGAATAAGELLSQEITNTLLVALGMGLVVLGILLYLAQRISRPIQMVTATMKELANGNTTVTAPAHKGTREIEAMTATVAVFRQSAINNIAMQESAEQLRQQMEQSRLDEQAKAEAAAAKRLAEATAGLALGLKRLAGGELNFQLTEAFAPEFETLRADFNQSVLQLEQTIVRVSQSVDTIRNGSHEMSRSADNLSRRTEQQAAMLEETAAALDEITANVSMSSQRTDEARDIAKQANSSAVQSGQVVTRAIDAMSRIETSSQKISNIIGVIDQIAFQTNLLALNAGVEAARAGDAGRGFAVVAMEVRELAQRSATAAKEIKELIQNSTQEVGTGVQLVSQTGAALKEIETFIVTINQHMDAIATSAREQTTGLSDVNRAINQMDQVTQQNAAMVEETNASGSTMAHETDNLQNLIGMFHTRHGASSTASQMRATSAFARDTDFELQRVA